MTLLVHVCSEKQMTKLSCTLATCFPELTTVFFDPLLHISKHTVQACLVAILYKHGAVC